MDSCMRCCRKYRHVADMYLGYCSAYCRDLSISPPHIIQAKEDLIPIAQIVKDLGNRVSSKAVQTWAEDNGISTTRVGVNRFAVPRSAYKKVTDYYNGK